jgi:hypothetical protein
MVRRIALAALSAALLSTVEPARGAPGDQIMIRADSATRAAAMQPSQQQPPPSPPSQSQAAEDSVSWGIEVESALGWMWRSFTGMVGSVVSAFSPPTPGEIARRIERKDSELWSLLDDAGYALGEIDTSLGLIPSAQVSFVQVRDLSAADREQLEWRLEQYARRDRGLSARLHRFVLYALLDASETGTNAIERIDITMWPIPNAKFSLGPTARGRSGETETLSAPTSPERKTL